MPFLRDKPRPDNFQSFETPLTHLVVWLGLITHVQIGVGERFQILVEPEIAL